MVFKLLHEHMISLALHIEIVNGKVQFLGLILCQISHHGVESANSIKVLAITELWHEFHSLLNIDLRSDEEAKLIGL